MLQLLVSRGVLGGCLYFCAASAGGRVALTAVLLEEAAS